MEKRKKDRIWYLECLRVLAMLSVISFHVSKTALSDFSFSLFTSSFYVLEIWFIMLFLFFL